MVRKQSSRAMRLGLSGGAIVTSVTVGTALIAAVTIYAPSAVQMTTLGAMVSLTIGLLVTIATVYQRDTRQQQRLLSCLRVPVALAGEPDLFHVHNDLSHSLVRLAQQTDTVLRDFSMLKLFGLAEDLRAMSHGRIGFSATESWREIYERILKSPGVDSYRSVAWIRSEDYWRDIPGERSLNVNLQLQGQGLPIERVLIICDFLWPPGARFPTAEIRQWIDRQHDQGIKIQLVREAELLNEQDLLLDFGIYGDRATGILQVDELARTQAFVLHFDRQSIELAKDRWQRLSLYTVSYQSLLDRHRRSH